MLKPRERVARESAVACIIVEMDAAQNFGMNSGLRVFLEQVTDCERAAAL